MVSRFSQVAIRGTFKLDFDGEVVVLYTLSDELMRQAREVDPTLAVDAGTFELLRFGRGSDYVTLIPRNTLPGHDEFLWPRYPRLQTITLEGFDLPHIESPNDVEAFLEQLPTGFIRDPEYGLGLLKELRPIVAAVDVSRWLVRSGWALAFRRYSTAYVADEDWAREHKSGLWSGAFVARWDWWHRGPKTMILGALDVPVDAQRKLMSPVVAGEPPASGCVIKGNLSRTDQCIYHVPSGRFYDRLRMEPASSRRWFCSEAEAEAAGCRRSKL